MCILVTRSGEIAAAEQFASCRCQTKGPYRSRQIAAFSFSRFHAFPRTTPPYL
jgi:hypothetical protein